ncbi:MAG: alpha-2-macroglobulin family protein [Victivallales bacterium]
MFVTSGLLNDDFMIRIWIISDVIVIFSLIFLLRGRNSLYRFFESSNRVHDIADTAVLLFFLFVIVFIAFNCAVYFFPNTPHLFLMCFTQLMLSFVPAVCLFTLKANIVGEGELAGKLQNAALGAGLGRRKKKVWLWFIVALCYAGPLIGIYFGVMIIVLALFMPLVCVIEKIGGDGGGGSSWSCSFNNKRPEYFSIKEPGSYFENLESGETRNGMAPVRRFFPETLLWKPELVTDPEGRASLEFKVGDSITDYALRAGAVSRDGRLGDAGCELRVFQNFFIDLYPPPKVTVDDEISIPVVLYNYLDKAQNIKLGIKEDPSFNVLAKPAEKKVDAKSTAKVYVPVRFIKTGSCVIRLTVESDSGCRDTVEREIKVVPDGRMVEEAINGFLVKNNSGTYEFPSRAFPENRSCFFKLYPAPMAEIPDTVTNMMRMPSGCFEQSSSITYPNILIYKYLKDHGKLSSANAETAKGYISTGYQKILSYQNGDGGFSLYNRWESSPLLTAYGIFILSEIEKEFHLGGRSLEGALAYIREVFRKENHGGLNLRETAYIVMALYDSGRSLYVPEEARDFIVRNADGNNDPYTLALCANALLIYDRVQARRILERLDGMKTESEGYCWWASSSGDRGVFNTSDKWLDIETTALIVNAMNRADFAPETIYKSVCWLMSMRSSNGLWGSTQSTVQVMRALLGIKSGALLPLGKGEKVDVKLSFNSLDKSLNIENDGAILPYSVDLETELKPGSNRFSVTSSRSAPLAYRFVMTYYMPWDVRPAGRGLELSVVYGKAELKPGEELDCFVEIKNSTRIDVPMGMISMNIPPGFEVEDQAMKRLYNEKVVSNYSMDSGKILFYFNEFSSRSPLKFSFRLKAKYPVKIKTPPVCAYAYYQPELSAVSAPQRLTVAEDKIRSEK